MSLLFNPVYVTAIVAIKNAIFKVFCIWYAGCRVVKNMIRKNILGTLKELYP